MHKEFNEWVLRNKIELIPEAHGFKVGEVVTVINGYGIPFHNQVIKGIEKEPRTYGGQFYVWDDAYWFPVQKEKLIKQNMKIENFIALIEKSSKESAADEFRCPRNKDENRTIYGMHFRSTRYIIDAAEDFAKGWEQLDTWQDAPYFGIWYNDDLRVILTYSEGDWSLVKCNTVESYKVEFEEAVTFYKRSKQNSGYY